MMKKFFQKNNNFSIRYKLFLSYLLLIVIPLFLFIMIISYISSKDTEAKAFESAKKVLSQASAFLQFKTSNIKNTLDIVVLDNTLHDIVTRNSNYYRENIGNGWTDQAAFYKIAFNLHGNPDIKDLQLYMIDGIASVEETNDFKRLEDVKQTEWYNALLKSSSSYFWFPAKYFPKSTSNSEIFFLEKIHGNSTINDFVGVIKVDIDGNVIKNLLKEAVFTKSTSVILTNSKNELISSSGNTDNEIINIISQTNPNDTSPIIWKTMTTKNKKSLIGVQSIEKTNMKLSIIIPYKDILGFNVKLRDQMLVILFIVILITLPLSFWVSGSGTKRIRLLIKHMKKIQKGDIKTINLHSPNDEIGDLISNFNYMIEEISVLMDDKFKLGKKLKNIELKALQAQINPHFLYNTLDLINWMSMRYEAPKIVDIVNSLSKFYKLSLSKGEDIVTIANEIEHSIAYLQIQNMRFDNNISYEFDIPKEIYDYTIPKITLQPLIENCILHGILEKESECGIIKIKGNLKDSIIYITIEDNGVGIAEEMVETIIQSKSHGYGIGNIDDRLKLIYGDEYGLSYSSIVNLGTKVIIKISAEKKL